MLISTHSRFFVRHQLRFRPERNHGMPLEYRSKNGAIDVEHVLLTAIADGTASYALRESDVIQLTKVETRENDRIAVLLLRRSDPDAGTPVFEHNKTHKIRRADKSDDESLAVSAHLFIDMKSIGHMPPTYRAILEEVPSLGRSYIDHLIGRLVRKQRYAYTDRHGDEVETYTVMDFHGVKSDTVKEAMKGGSISYVELVRPAKVEGLDAEGLVMPRDERMKLAITATPDKAPGIVDKVKSWAYDREWSNVVVQVSLPDHRSRVVPLSRREDAADVLFVRSEQVSVETAMDPCTDIVNDELVACALAMFDDESGWR
jgi:hypothetical protein